MKNVVVFVSDGIATHPSVDIWLVFVFFYDGLQCVNSALADKTPVFFIMNIVWGLFYFQITIGNVANLIFH